MKGRMSHKGNEWIVKVICGGHNHSLLQHFEGNTFIGRLTCSELDLVIEMSKCNVRPKYILYRIKQHDENNATTIKHIYNARSKYKINEQARGLYSNSCCINYRNIDT